MKRLIDLIILILVFIFIFIFVVLFAKAVEKEDEIEQKRQEEWQKDLEQPIVLDTEVYPNLPEPTEDYPNLPEYRVETYTLTAYCPCSRCSGEYGCSTASGEKATPNHTIASWLPMGTEVEIDGTTYTVEDRTAEWVKNKYNGKIIDIYFDTHEEVRSFGKRVCEVKIYE